MLNKILGALAGLALFVAMLFRSKALKAQKQQAEQRADVAEAASDNLQSINQARDELSDEHRKENIDAEEKHADDQRDGLDNHW